MKSPPTCDAATRFFKEVFDQTVKTSKPERGKYYFRKHPVLIDF